MQKTDLLLLALILFAIASSSLLILDLLGFLTNVTSTTTQTAGSHISLGRTVVLFLSDQSPLLTLASWSLVVVGFVWRGNVRNTWRSSGLSPDVFKLVTMMKGSANRVQLLKGLTVPKDRFQLAKDLSLDWATVDYHVKVLLKHELIRERVAYGQVKVYELTSLGSTLLNVLEETSHNQSNG